MKQPGEFRSGIRKNLSTSIMMQHIAQRWGILLLEVLRTQLEKAKADLTGVGHSPA